MRKRRLYKYYVFSYRHSDKKCVSLIGETLSFSSAKKIKKDFLTLSSSDMFVKIQRDECIPDVPFFRQTLIYDFL